MPVVARAHAGPLVGRAAETELLTSLLDSVSGGGGALVLRGEPGIGKSRLLAAAASAARTRGLAVLGTTGVQSEARLSFSGLHQLLRPVRAHAAGLPPLLRDALDTAFGLLDGPAPERFRIALAALEVLSDVAGEAPVLVVVEDAQWLDRASADALAFVARRLEHDPIVLLAAVRDGYGSALTDAGLPELRIGALEPGAAAALLDASGQRLTSQAREQVLREAAGNPLALLELPVTSTRLQPSAAVPGLRPLTERLEQAFAARVRDLPEQTRLLLLVAALDDGDRVGEALRAGSAVAGTALGLEALEPAVQAAVIDRDQQAITFRHPLMRSAVVQSATSPQRRRVHEALAEVLHGDPDRRVWHRAALLAGVHEDVAVELEDAGRRARRRGAIGVAASALRRSAELSDDAHRGRRLLTAAQSAFELGQPEVVVPLLREAERLDPGPLEQARATWITEMVDLRPFRDTTRAAAVLAAAEHARDAGDRDLCIDLLWVVAQRMWWVGAEAGARQPLVAAVRALGGVDDARVLAVLAFADPVGTTPTLVRRLQAAATERSADAEVARHLGGASIVVGAFDTGSTALSVAVEGLRAEGRLGHLPRLLALQGMVAARLADWDVAIPAAEESRRLADELAEPLWGAGAETVIATIAGMRGDEETAEQASSRAERTALPLGAKFMVCYAQFGRVLAALGAARHADAYALASRLFDPADPAHHSAAWWHVGDLAEAALHVGRTEHARACVAEVEAAVGATPGIAVELSLRHARAVLAADDEEATARFDEALGADLALWPFPHARLLLAHGQWLRRRRRIAESRTPLRAARDTFDRLGCEAWSAQARRELRASGEASRRRDPAGRDRLTAQELQIARLAAQGLSNREIGQRLYLSHRTIGTHLYRAFPKLGITARSELERALDVPGAAH